MWGPILEHKMPPAVQVNFGLRSDDYARYRPGFPASFYDRLERTFPISDSTGLDLGTGPGTVALELARRGANVLGLDISEHQIDAARRMAQEHGLGTRARFEVGRAEQLPLQRESVDFVTAGQCWVWFDHEATMAEVRRVLRPKGHLVVAHYNYLAHQSRVAAVSEDLILKHNPGWKMAGCSGLYPRHIDDLQDEDMRLVEQFCYDCDQAFTHESWRGRMRTCNGVGAGGMSEEEVARYDSELANWLAREFPQHVITVRHRVWAVVCRKQA